MPLILEPLNCSLCERYLGTTYCTKTTQQQMEWINETPSVLCNLCTLSQIELSNGLGANWYISPTGRVIQPSDVLGYSANDNNAQQKSRAGRWSFMQAFSKLKHGLKQ